MATVAVSVVARQGDGEPVDAKEEDVRRPTGDDGGGGEGWKWWPMIAPRVV